jgi:hypothetical protein
MNQAQIQKSLDTFPLAPTQAVPRIVASAWGDVGTGKTRFAAGGPGPVIFLGFDDGTEGVVEDLRESGKEIRVLSYDWSPTNEEEFTQAQAVELRNTFIADYKRAIDTLAALGRGTVVMDKETDVWNLFRYAEFGSPKADVPRDFDKVNAMMRKYISLPKKTTINFMAIQSAKDEWKSMSQKSGAIKRAGFGETPGLLHVDLFFEREGGKFYTTVGKVRGKNAAGITDQRFENLDFKTLGIMLFPDADEAVWE